jgi:hypothetical protein
MRKVKTESKKVQKLLNYGPLSDRIFVFKKLMGQKTYFISEMAIFINFIGFFLWLDSYICGY